MAVRITDDLKLGALFTKDGKDVWELVGYWTTPSFHLRNLRTGEDERFGTGGLMDAQFKRLLPEGGKA